jgi:hypothetical protein
VSSGFKPEIVVLESVISKEQLDEAEIRLIALFKKLGHRLTNMTVGGEGICGHRHSEEAKRKIGQKNSVALLGHEPWNKGRRSVDPIICNGCQKPFVCCSRGRKYCSAACYRKSGVSDESKKKISAALSGRKNSTEHVRKVAEKHMRAVRCLDDGKIFASIQDAAAANRLSSDTVSKICRGVQGPTRSGLSFSYCS